MIPDLSGLSRTATRSRLTVSNISLHHLADDGLDWTMTIPVKASIDCRKETEVPLMLEEGCRKVTLHKTNMTLNSNRLVVDEIATR